jgi:hypothetical protein
MVPSDRAGSTELVEAALQEFRRQVPFVSVLDLLSGGKREARARGWTAK